MNKLRFHVVVVALGALFSQSAIAEDNLWFGVKAGTLGLGLEATWRPIPYLDFRAGLNKFDYDVSGAQGGIDYNSDLNLDSMYVTANFRVPLNPLRFTVGVFSNGNELSMVSQGAISNIGGDTTFSSDEIGTLRSTTSFESTAPYLGIGFDFRAFNKVGINLDIGFLWQDSPIVTLTSDGTGAGVAFDAALEMERQDLENALEEFKVYPVISLGFAVNF